MALRRRSHTGVSKATTPKILAVLVIQLLRCDAFVVTSRVLGGAALSSPAAPPSCWRGRRSVRQTACSSRRGGPRRFSKGLCNGSRRQASAFYRLRSKPDNGDDTGSTSRINGEGGGDETVLSITTFNVLAPIFKRVGTGRESEFREAYLSRHAAIIQHLKVRRRRSCRASI